VYRHILIPTDGTQLSQNAIAHGAALAKSINAEVTILTVSTPFHTFAVEPEMVTDKPCTWMRSRMRKLSTFSGQLCSRRRPHPTAARRPAAVRTLSRNTASIRIMAARRATSVTIVHRTTSDPREQPGALAAHAGICAAGEEKSSSLPRP
jgi:nucleotide-binding universal stress UspA family protein